ncbi:MAG: SdrD B-like domain-containing protein, partial [Steroidobacteraceae bacterium]
MPRILPRMSPIRWIALLAALASGPVHAVPLVEVLTLQDSVDPIPATSTLTYSVQVSNVHSSLSANGVNFALALPAGVTFLSASNGACSFSAPNVSCALGTLLPEQDVGITIDVRVTAAGGSVLTAQATATSSTPGETPSVIQQTTTVISGADLALSMAASPDPVPAGAVVTYTLDTQNLGPDVASGLRIVDTLPPNVAFEAFSGAGWSCSAAGSTVTCNRAGSLANGASSALTIQARVQSSISGTLTNSATLTATTGDGLPNNNTTTAQVNVLAGADLSITKLASPNPMIASAPATFTLQPRNAGPDAASAVTVTDTLPVGFTAISASGTNWSCSVSQPSRSISCTRAAMPVGASNDITINATAPDNTVVPPAGLVAANTANVAATTADPEGANNASTVNFTVQRDGADMSIFKAKSPNPVAAGSPLTSTMRATNGGPRALTGTDTLTITDTLQVGEDYSGSAAFTDNGWNCTFAAPTFTCARAGPLAVGATTPTLTLVTTATSAAALTNQACIGITGAQTDPNGANNCTTASSGSTAAHADLRILKSQDMTTVPSASNVLTYTLTIGNDGPQDSSNVVIRDVIPMRTTLTGGTVINAVAGAGSKGSAGSCGVVDATVTCNYATLLYESAGTGTPNTAETAIITVTVTRPMADGSFTNTATIASTSVGDPDHSDNTSSVNTTVDPIADVEVQSKSVTPNSLEAGVDATYVITFRNRGPSTAQNVTLTDQFNPAGGDAGYEIRSVTASKGNCAPHDAGTHSIVCSVGTLAATEVQTLQVVVRPIWMAAPPGGRNLPNTATVGTTTADSDATNDSKNAVLAITGAAIDLLANISDVPSVVGVPADPLGFDATAPASNLITYRAQVSNLGPSEATSVDFVNTYTPPAGRTVTFLCDSTDQYACTGVPFCSNVSGASETGPTPQVVSCAVGDMEAGSNVHRFLRYRVDTAPAASGDTYSNAVTVSANEVDTNPGNNNASEPTAVRAKADLQVTSKTAVVASPPLQYGQTFQWQIKVRNNGPGIAFQSVLTDTLPANMELVLPLAASVSPTGSCSNTGAAQFSCNLGDVSVGAGDERTITVDVRIVRPAVAPFPTNYTNTASVSTFSVDLVPANDSNTGSVTLVKSTVAGRVYRDHDNDGVIDGGENGVASVTLTLAGTDVFGNAVSRTTTTDGTGNYLFDNLEQSNGSGYTITETQPAGFADGLEAVGSAATGAAPGGLASATIGSNTITGIVLDKDQAATGYNFGELRQNSLGGNVFADRNNNGTAQAGDTGIANVTVTLTGTDARGVVVTRSTTTNASGVYSFANVLPGTYTLTQTQPASFLDGIDTVGNRGGSGAVNDEFSAIVLTDQDGTGYNFAERPGSISGRVWRDADRNGTLDGGEAGITGVTVSLSGTDTLGNAVTRTTTTDGSGDYSFGDLPAGTYTVTETQPAGFASTTSNTLTGIVIGAAGTSAGHNFGDSTGALAGTVFFDRDANGASNGSDDGIAGVTLTLAGTNAAGGAVILTTTTDATGAFAFNDLLAPDASGYTLTQTQPTAYANGQVTAGSAAGTVNQGLNRVSAIALPVGVAATGYLFAELGTPISGTVYRDANRDSVKQPGEPGITGVTVELRDSGNALVATTTTAADGSYGFPPQAGGSYTVLETQPAGYSSGPQNAGNSVAIALVAGTPAVIDFGESTGSLAGTVFLDVDNDGVQDAGDVGLPGTTVTLSGTDALGAAVSRSTTTNSAGQYLFADLLSGTYTVTETQPSLFGDGAEVLGAGNAGGTVGNDVYGAIALGIGVQATGYNFAETGSAVTGVVYRDFTRDGARQAGDTPIAGVTLTLRDAGNVVIGTTTTAADGSYLFAGVATGSYTVVESQPAGYGSSPTSPDTVAVIVPLNGAATADFADTLSTLAGAVYVDLNGNGARDAGESGIAAVTVTLTGTDAAGAAVNRSAGTDATGAFSFIDLPTPNGAGYTLAQAQPPTFADGLDAAGTAGGSAGNDVIGAIHLPVNTDATGYLFGEGGSTITGAVFRDINANGTREGADTPIAGVVIVARDATSVVVATTTTAADGSYRFVGLPAGSYTIEETQPAGYGSSTPNSVAVTVAIGSSSGADFGETTASIAGQVWADTNANGTRDAGEPPIAGVALALTGTDAAGAAVSRATVTDAAGAYSFGDVLGGTYTLTETQPGAYADGTERAGTAGGTVGNDVISAITLPVGTAATGYDFAELGQSIRGRVWRDSDRDASLDAAESGIAGVVITLRSAGTIIATTTSDATGAYSFSNIPAGQYSVDETQPLGHGSSTPDSVIVDLLAGAVTPTIDFGDTVGSLAGRVFNDTNNNGVVDPGEPGIADATVQLAGTD